jgi:hypothetical protein
VYARVGLPEFFLHPNTHAERTRTGTHEARLSSESKLEFFLHPNTHAARTHGHARGPSIV